MSEEKDISVGFMGCGMMASALMGGLVSEKLVKDPASISCSDVWKPSVEKAASKGYSATTSNETVCSSAKDAIVIAVKPDVVKKRALANWLRSTKFLRDLDIKLVCII